MGFRVGIGHDTHRLGAARPLRLGGLTIPHESGLVGHSDADVLLHAITDAILGAGGAGDIGELFPDTDPANKDKDSAEMLAAARDKALGATGRVVNLDCTVFAEAPKLSVHKPALRESIARLLGVRPEQVSVKAKTGERVGPIGRKEAIGAEAIVLVEWPDEPPGP